MAKDSALDRMWEDQDPQRIRLKDRPDLGEEWVKDRLTADPAMLQLGPLVLEDRERRQRGAGRLDLLFHNTEVHKTYEVEVQLGRLNASHVLRAIEYWEMERMHLPDEDHCVVLIAEDVTGSRFLVATRILAEYIPIIAMEAQVLELNNKVSLELTRISLARSARPSEPTEEEVGTVAVMLNQQMATEKLILEIVGTFAPDAITNQTKSYVGLRRSPGGKYFAILRPRRTGVQLDLILERSTGLENELDEEELSFIWSHRKGRDGYRISLGEEGVQDSYVLIRRLLLASYENVK